MLSCARAVTSRAWLRPSVASRSLATVSIGNADTSGIPIVDFANFGSLSFAQRRETSRQIVDGFKNMGFVYLVNHGISDKTVQEAFKRVRGPTRCKIQLLNGTRPERRIFPTPAREEGQRATVFRHRAFINGTLCVLLSLASTRMGGPPFQPWLRATGPGARNKLAR